MTDSDGAEITRLAALPPLDYEREREAAAERLGCRVAILDRLVEDARASANATPKGGANSGGGAGRALAIPEMEPWPEPVDGAALLDDLATTARRYVIISAVQADAIALWIVHTHAFGATDVTPKLVANSSVMRSGKTRLGEMLERSVSRPLLVAGGITSSALLRIIEMHAPTLLLDEMDALMKRNRELSEALRGIMNSGFNRTGARYIMNVPTAGGGWEPREFSTWAPQFLSGIGDLPGTVRDRSIEIKMSRKLGTERVERLRRKDGKDLHVLACKSARWAQDNFDALGGAQPEIPAGLNDRAADAWEALFGIADRAGGEWPERARRAAIALARDENDDAETPGIMLLADLRELFATEPRGVLFTAEIVPALHSREDRSWAEYQRGRPITDHQVAALLRPLGIRTNKNVRRGLVTAKGYKAEEFADPWARYLPPH